MPPKPNRRRRLWLPRDNTPYEDPIAERRRLERIAWVKREQAKRKHATDLRCWRRKDKRISKELRKRKTQERKKRRLLARRQARHADKLARYRAGLHHNGYISVVEEQQIKINLDIATWRAVKCMGNLEVLQLLTVRESHRGMGEWRLASQCANRLIRRHAFNVRHLYKRGAEYVAWWMENREAIFAERRERMKRLRAKGQGPKSWRCNHEDQQA